MKMLPLPQNLECPLALGDEGYLRNCGEPRPFRKRVMSRKRKVSMRSCAVAAVSNFTCENPSGEDFLPTLCTLITVARRKAASFLSWRDALDVISPNVELPRLVWDLGSNWNGSIAKVSRPRGSPTIQVTMEWFQAEFSLSLSAPEMNDRWGITSIE